MLNTTPLSSHRTFADYANFLNRRYVLPNFAKEVHILFDNPGRLPQTPKSFERKRKDLQATVIVGHVCDAIEDSRYIPSKWREDIVNCTNCKRILVLYLAKYYMKNFLHNFNLESSLFWLGVLMVIEKTQHGSLPETVLHNHAPVTNVMQRRQTHGYGYTVDKPIVRKSLYCLLIQTFIT